MLKFCLVSWILVYNFLRSEEDLVVGSSCLLLIVVFLRERLVRSIGERR